MLGVVAESLGAHPQACLLKGSLQQARVEFADDILSLGAGLPSVAVDSPLRFS